MVQKRAPEGFNTGNTIRKYHLRMIQRSLGKRRIDISNGKDVGIHDDHYDRQAQTQQLLLDKLIQAEQATGQFPYEIVFKFRRFLLSSPTSCVSYNMQFLIYYVRMTL